MTGRQVLDRVVLRVADTDIRLAGDWDPIPEKVLRLHAPEVANLCQVSLSAVATAKSIGQLAGRIGDRFINRHHPLLENRA